MKVHLNQEQIVMGMTMNLMLRLSRVKKAMGKWKEQFFCLQNQFSKEVPSQCNKRTALLVCLRFKYWNKSAINTNLFFDIGQNPIDSC